MESQSISNLTQLSSFDNWTGNMAQFCHKAQIDIFTNNSCGLVFNKVIAFDIDIVKFSPLVGSSYIDLLSRRKAKQASLSLRRLGTHKNKDVF